MKATDIMDPEEVGNEDQPEMVEDSDNSKNKSAEDEVLVLSDGEDEQEGEEEGPRSNSGSVNALPYGENSNGQEGAEGEEDDEVVEVPDDDEEEEYGEYDGEEGSGAIMENGDNSMDVSEVTDTDSRSNDLVIKPVQGVVPRNANGGGGGGEDDDDDVQLISDDDGDGTSQSLGLSRNGNRDDNDEVMEVENPDPLSNCESEDNASRDSIGGITPVNKQLIPSSLSLTENGDSDSLHDSDSKSSNTIVVNDTKSLVDLANSKKEPGKEPTLVIIDTNAIMAGKGAVPVNKLLQQPRSKSSIDIPDDAYLIEAPSFIVPYVFEQGGEKSLKQTIKDLSILVKEEVEAREAKGEELAIVDKLYEPKKYNPEEYFESPVGRLLTTIGMNMVQEYVQYDLLKMQKRQGEKEKAKSRMGVMTQLTQNSIISLKKNIEESKENNAPFKAPMKKCELCNFKTESELVMSTHNETPHMKNYSYRCNFCIYTTRVPHEIIFHMEAEHAVRARLERAPAYHQCPNCAFEDNSKAKLTRHLLGCQKRFVPNKNLEPPTEWDTPAKLPKLPKNRMLPQGINPAFLAPNNQRGMAAFNNQMLQKQLQAQGINMKGNLPPLLHAAPKNKPIPGLIRTSNPRAMNPMINPQLQRGGMMIRGQMQTNFQQQMNNLLPQMAGAQMRMGNRPGNQPSISITPLPRQGTAAPVTQAAQKMQGQTQGGKTSFVICEICDGYIKDLDQLRNHMQWIHKVKIHPKMIYNKPPLNCQKCQFRFFTDQGLERHLLGSHGLVTSSMQDAANRGQDSGRCPLCGKVYQWKLLAHVAKDHNVTLKPAHLSYKCTVCTATFGMYKLFESHVYSAHSVTKNAPRPDRRPGMAQPMPGKMGQIQVTSRSSPSNNNSYKPLKINDEITIIPQPMANSGVPRSKGSLTITPQPMRKSVPMRSNDDDGIQIIEIDDASQKNGMRPNGNRFPMSETLRKRNLEISVCDDSEGAPMKRLRQN